MVVSSKLNGNGNGSLISAALILGAASLISDVVGLVRERVFTSTFGAGDTFDAFVAAFRIPDAIFNLIVVAALSAAFIPIFTQKLVQDNDGGKSAFRFAASVLNIIMVLVIGFTIVYVIWAPQIVHLITPGFSGSKLDLTVMLSRIMALQPVILASSFVISGVLNSFKRFVAYALAPILYNTGIILGVVWLYPMIGVAGLAWGVVLGAILHMAVQLPSFFAIGFRWQPVWISSQADMRILWRMILPRIFGLGAQQINLMLVTIMGSELLSGSISSFHLANNIQYVPIGIFGISFAQAAFPTLSEQMARGQLDKFRLTLTKTFRYILFLVLPMSVWFYLLRAQIIRVLFGAGAFTWQDTIMTFETFGALTVSIFAQATIPLLTRAFYARHDTKTPVIISFLSIGANVLLALWLAPKYGVVGLAAAFSISAVFNLALLLGILHWQLKGFNDRQVLLSLVRIVIGTVAGGIALQLLKTPIANLVDMNRFWGVATQSAGTFMAGTIVYFVACWIMRSPELKAIIMYLPRKFKLIPGMETSRFGGLLE